MILTFSHSIKGLSHEENGMPMLDFSGNFEDGNARIIIVSDGHGSDIHFRNDRGAKFAVLVTKECLINFIKVFSPTLRNNTFVQRGVMGITDTNSEDYTIEDENENTFRQLFDSIKLCWIKKVEEDWKQDPPTSMELKRADSQGKIISTSDYTDDKIYKAYGCTLIAAVQTNNYWMAIQIGDGRCIAFNEDGDWYEPIPWDSRCFLNITTSLCQEGKESFRYCYGNTPCPALFIGSDGMDDSYIPIAKLAEFYGTIVQVVSANNIDYATEQLKLTMPNISRDGSRDDISIAFWLNNENLNDLSEKINFLKKRQLLKDKEKAELEKQELEESLEQLKKDKSICNKEFSDIGVALDKASKIAEKAQEGVKSAEEMLSDAQAKLRVAKINQSMLQSHQSAHRVSLCAIDDEIKNTKTKIQSLSETINTIKYKLSILFSV